MGVQTYRLWPRRPRDGQLSLGLSCDEEGLCLASHCRLVTPALNREGRRFYRAQPIGEINAALSAGYGTPVNAAPLYPTITRIAEYMTRGEWTLATLAAVHLGLPELPNQAAAHHLLKATTTAWDPGKHPRWPTHGGTLTKYSPDQPRVPAGNPGGGQWASGADNANGQPRLDARENSQRPAVSVGNRLSDGVIPIAAGDFDEYVPCDQLPSNAKDILQHRILSPDGTMHVGLPDGYVATPSRTGAGAVFRKPGTTDNTNTIRVMPPDDVYPTGRVIIYNGAGQAISPYSGRTGSPSQYHYEFKGMGPKAGQ